MEHARLATLADLRYRQAHIEEVYGRRSGAAGASGRHINPELVPPGIGGCGPSLMRSTSTRLRRTLSSRPHGPSRPSTTVPPEPSTQTQHASPHDPSILDPHRTQYHQTKLNLSWGQKLKE
ncbi:hypothetical protein AMTR_s00088p00101000 [Amborella trichopoda]|uniref:Uncharacterized protein n=1 Tax=Amborella trichopoda TaxID=13333 RepID=W1NXX7_AMBTC|nr:hypothetical protein AMTR_s00088p00101000 [Amborella trichopoda]